MVVRKPIRPEEIAFADLHAIDAELARRDVQQPLADEHAMLAAGAAHRRDDRLVGEDGRERAVVVLDVVRAEQRALRVDRDGQPVRIVGAGVEQEHVLDAEDPSVTRQRHLRVVHLPALLRRRVEILLAIFGPFDRPAEPHRRPGHEQLLGVEHHDLRAEAAADKRRHDPDLRLQQPELRREAVANRNRRLGRVPDGELFGLRVPLRDDRTILHRRCRAAVVEQPARDDDVCPRPRGRVVALALDDVGCGVRFEVLVHERRAGSEGGLEVDDRIQRIDVHDDVADRVFGDVPAGGDDHRDRFADVADLLPRERQVRARMKDQVVDRRRRDEERRRLRVLAEVVRRVDREHAGAAARRRRVDRSDARVRVVAAHEGDVRHARQVHVVHEARAAGEQPLVFVADDARVKVARLCRHG